MLTQSSSDRSPATEAVQFQLVRAEDVGLGGSLVEQELADFLRNDAALFRMAHDRVTQVQRLRVHGLDALHTGEDRSALFGAAR